MKKLIVFIFLSIFFLPIITFGKIDESYIRSVVQIKILDNLQGYYISSGSGVFIDGITVLTNYHVVENAISSPDRYSVIICFTTSKQPEPSCTYKGSTSGLFGGEKQYLKDLDLALVSINERIDQGEIKDIWNWNFSDLLNDEFLKHDNINISVYGYELSGIKIGDSVQTIGYPAEGGKAMSYSDGSVTDFDFNQYGDALFIETSARITPGSSGGAAFDSNGKFIGITSRMWADQSGNFISGLIIPVSTVNWWLQEVQGYRVNKTGEYTILDEQTEQAIRDAFPSADVKNQSCPENSISWENECRCQIGFVLLRESNKCVKWEDSPYTKSVVDLCNDNYGYGSRYKGKDSQGSIFCDCKDGYILNDAATSCIKGSKPERIKDNSLIKEELKIDVKKEDKKVNHESVQTDIQKNNETLEPRVVEEILKTNFIISIIKPVKTAIGKFFNKLVSWFLNN